MEHLANLADSILFAGFIVTWGKTENLFFKKGIAAFIISNFMMLNIMFAAKYDWNFIVPMALDLGIIIIIGKKFLENTWKDAVISYFIMYAIDFISIISASVIIEILCGSGWDGWRNFQSHMRGLYLITTKVILAIGLYVAYRIRKRNIYIGKPLLIWNYIILPIIAFVICLKFVSFMLESSLREEENLMVVIGYLWVICLLALSIFISVYVFQDKVKKQETENLKDLLLMEQENYHRLIEYEKGANKSRHNLKNKLLAISYLLREGKVDTGIQHLISASEELLGQHCDISSRQGIWNVIIDNKVAQKQYYDLQLTRNIKLLEIGSIDEVDFSVILGNLLDNALEALRDCKDKKLLIVLCEEKGYIFIEMRNSYHKKETMQRTDKSGLEHGYGIMSVKEIIYRYRGTYEAFIENGMYVARVLLPNTIE